MKRLKNESYEIIWFLNKVDDDDAFQTLFFLIKYAIIFNYFLQTPCTFDKLEKHDMSILFDLRYDKFFYKNLSAKSLIDRIMLNLKKFAQDTPLKGIRSDYFYTIKKECFNDVIVTTDDNGA